MPSGPECHSQSERYKCGWMLSSQEHDAVIVRSGACLRLARPRIMLIIVQGYFTTSPSIPNLVKSKLPCTCYFTTSPSIPNPVLIKLPCSKAKGLSFTDLSHARALTDLSCAFTDLSCAFTDLSCAFTGLSHVFTGLSHAFPDLSLAFSGLSRAFTDLSRAFTDLSHAFTDLSCAFTDLSCAFTDFSLAHAWPIYSFWKHTGTKVYSTHASHTHLKRAPHA